MRQGGFRVFINPDIHKRPPLTQTRDKDVALMPNIDVNSPVSAAPNDRLTLGVGWVRPGAAGVVPSSPATYCCSGCAQCFEGSEE